ncbi:uncharacterized protein CDAR_279441 [Caerostris darwini]|uniref:Uncharacterized protein n=1 Tax=Caerostris darwini TaxID=1538125 RepID=A0AAV4VP03_9ARAC|nr:uncharacterized protein CDAR_279441 [Caerostris darwini]
MSTMFILAALSCIALVAADGVHLPQPYKFGYSIKDKHGEQHRHESGNGAGAVVGSYGFTDNKGIGRQVNYVADKAGFRAQVKTNEPGTANQNPAAVQVISNAPYSKGAAESYGDEGYSSQMSGYGGYNRGYGNQKREYGDYNNGYGNQMSGYGGYNRGYDNQMSGYGGYNRGYGNQMSGYVGYNRGYGNQMSGYGGYNRGYGNQMGGYGGYNRGYDNQMSGYGGYNRGYGNQMGDMVDTTVVKKKIVDSVMETLPIMQNM